MMAELDSVETTDAAFSSAPCMMSRFPFKLDIYSSARDIFKTKETTERTAKVKQAFHTAHSVSILGLLLRCFSTAGDRLGVRFPAEKEGVGRGHCTILFLVYCPSPATFLQDSFPEPLGSSQTGTQAGEWSPRVRWREGVHELLR